jgi:hypothetical protein
MKNSQRKKEETLRTVHLDQKFTTADLSFFTKKKTPVNVPPVRNKSWKSL